MEPGVSETVIKQEGIMVKTKYKPGVKGEAWFEEIQAQPLTAEYGRMRLKLRDSK